ncbi:MAG TPA: glycine cleavage T C-terminal barrel domain-containing protein [Candidatus Acidoferrales bacterium]|nr:glycine cleavage T C-terminal barrel domain-containing protein [Candidatus Acidoferrales bacterium]
MDTPLIDAHRAAGAQLAEFQGCTLPERFSDFEKEYRAAKQSVGLIDSNWHAILVLAGRDRVQYLHNISSGDIKSLAEGRGTLALLLNPQGHILAELEVYALPEKLLVLSHVSQRERTVATLKKYVIGSHVQIDDQTDRMGSVAVEGPRAMEVIADLCGVSVADLPEMSAQETAVEGVSGFLVKRSHFAEPGAEIVAPRENLPALWSKLLAAVRASGGEPIGMAALNALRLEAGVPWFPVDFNEAHIPHEAAVENTHISFNKGCYTGQEIVERVRSRGHVNRKRVLLKFSTATPPTSGTKLYAGGAEVGYVTSAAFSPATGTSIGMGYVRQAQFAPGSILEVHGGTAKVR